MTSFSVKFMLYFFLKSYSFLFSLTAKNVAPKQMKMKTRDLNQHIKRIIESVLFINELKAPKLLLMHSVMVK